MAKYRAKVETRCCKDCVYSMRPQSKWLKALLSRLPALMFCFNCPLAPGKMQEVNACQAACRNFRTRRRPRGLRGVPPESTDDTIRYIPVSPTEFAIVDREDYEELSKYKWGVRRCGRHVYAIRYDNRKVILMHRAIMHPPDNMLVDHFDGNGLNNRRSNLRICTPAQNTYNSRPRGGASKFKGVDFVKRTGKYRAAVGHKGKKCIAGEFRDEVEAARARDKLARQLQGEYAWINLPEKGERGYIEPGQGSPSQDAASPARPPIGEESGPAAGRGESSVALEGSAG